MHTRHTSLIDLTRHQHPSRRVTPNPLPLPYGFTRRRVAFFGDFSSANRQVGRGMASLPLVELACSKCNSNDGVTVVFPAPSFTGGLTNFKIKLREGAGWLQDPKNSLTEWAPPSKCAFIEVLSGLSSGA